MFFEDGEGDMKIQDFLFSLTGSPISEEMKEILHRLEGDSDDDWDELREKFKFHLSFKLQYNRYKFTKKKEDILLFPMDYDVLDHCLAECFRSVKSVDFGKLKNIFKEIHVDLKETHVDLKEPFLGVKSENSLKFDFVENERCILIRILNAFMELSNGFSLDMKFASEVIEYHRKGYFELQGVLRPPNDQKEREI